MGKRRIKDASWKDEPIRYLPFFIGSGCFPFPFPVTALGEERETRGKVSWVETHRFRMAYQFAF